MDTSAIVRRSWQRAVRLTTGPHAISALLVGALGWQLAGLTWTSLPAAPPAAPPDAAAAPPAAADTGDPEPPPAARLAQLHLFGRPPVPEPEAQMAEAPETELNLTLKGIYAPGSGAGTAVISAGDGAEEVYSVGDTVAGGALITGIFSDRVMLRRGGQAEILRMGGEQPGATADRPDSGPRDV